MSLLNLFLCLEIYVVQVLVSTVTASLHHFMWQYLLKTVCKYMWNNYHNVLLKTIFAILEISFRFLVCYWKRKEREVPQTWVEKVGNLLPGKFGCENCWQLSGLFIYVSHEYVSRIVVYLMSFLGQKCL